MTETQGQIIRNLNSSLTNLHTVRVGYISKAGDVSERVATVNYMRDGIVNFATAKGFRSMLLDNIAYADVSYAN